jgi:hypothetical protein
LEKDFSLARLKSIIDPRYEDMPAPAEFTLDGNSCTLADLEPTDFGLPSQALPAKINDNNFRKWMVIEFQPDPEQETGYDACLDLWMAVVDVGGEMKIGYYEPADPD